LDFSCYFILNGNIVLITFLTVYIFPLFYFCTTITASNVCHDTYGSNNLTVPNFLKVRRQVFIAGNSEPRENIAVLDELIDARDEFAKVSTFSCTVEHILNRNMHPDANVFTAFVLNFT
jgi:hypothetical protein